MADIFLEENSLSDRNSCSIHQTWSSNDNWPQMVRSISNPKQKKSFKQQYDLWTDDNPSALETYGEINTWDVSLITVMNRLFEAKYTFNDDISNWDVSNVIDMSNMFLNYVILIKILTVRMYLMFKIWAACSQMHMHLIKI